MEMEQEQVEPIPGSDQIMLLASNTNCGEVDIRDDYLVSTKYLVRYDGTMEMYATYHLSGDTEHQIETMNDSDYCLLYNWLKNEFVEYTYQVDSCDGDDWSFTYYDEDGTELYRFSGYIYGSDLLDARIARLLVNYLYGYQEENNESSD